MSSNDDQVTTQTSDIHMDSTPSTEEFSDTVNTVTTQKREIYKQKWAEMMSSVSNSQTILDRGHLYLTNVIIQAFTKQQQQAELASNGVKDSLLPDRNSPVKAAENQQVIECVYEAVTIYSCVCVLS